MDKPISRYEISGEEDQTPVLPNLLGIKSLSAIHKAEFSGFLKTQYLLLEQLKPTTQFNTEYILNIHHQSLSHIYSFAGKLRTVNISKGGFLFPTARFLPEIMEHFQKDILDHLPLEYNDLDTLISDIARVHAELLFIHPFREANGRVARILANLMAVKQGYDFLGFYKIRGQKFKEYILAVQAAADENYSLMEKLIKWIF